MKKAFTLIEIIVTIVILGILAAGTFVSLKQLYLRSAKSKAISELSFTTQVVADQIAALLYDRVPSTVIGYEKGGSFKPISLIYSDDVNYTILEWIGTSIEAYKSGYYSGFVDLDASDKISKTIVSFGVSSQDINNSFEAKFRRIRNSDDIALIFAGSFDDASLVSSNDFNNSFGWHGYSANLVHTFTASDHNITFDIAPREIYEKYYLIDSAYAIARGNDVDINASCLSGMNINENTLLLFYDYRPWKVSKETFCADENDPSIRAGKATILAEYVKGFQSGILNNSLYFSLSAFKHINGSENDVTISKEKVVF